MPPFPIETATPDPTDGTMSSSLIVGQVLAGESDSLQLKNKLPEWNEG